MTDRDLVVFSDLDGTLLDHETYDFRPALPALDELRARAIPLVLVTSKTRAEVERLRTALDHRGPFVVENGGAIYVPEIDPPPPAPGGLRETVLGTPYEVIRRHLDELRRDDDFSFEGFGDVSAERVATWSGLTVEDAMLAQDRASSEPIRFSGDDRALERFARALAARGLSMTRGGRFWCVQGRTDKGKAVRHLLGRLAPSHAQSITSVAVGDSDNDIPMLEAADVAIVLLPAPARAPIEIDHPRVIRPEQRGPAGFSAGIFAVLAEYGE